MKISINTLQKLVNDYGCVGSLAPHGNDALEMRIGAQLGAIEETVALGDKYRGIVIARIVSCDKHPNADRLNICIIDDGGKTQTKDQVIQRDDNGLIQVVCGAPNVRAGLTVAWLPPGSIVPESHDKEPFVLSVRKLRGVVSNGMLASSRELMLGDNHSGILEIDGDIAPGTDFATYFGLVDDVVFDIENKMFTHRPDCFGFLGVARELAGIQQLPFKSPEWYRADAPIPERTVDVDELPLSIHNELPSLLPRYTAITIRDVEVKPSPVAIQVELAKVGQRPINNIVDLTNWFMLETGQPVHAYDYDKVKALGRSEQATIVLRHPQPGERIKLLNGKEIEPRRQAIMIATDTSLIAVGGIMGGADTEVDESTENIIIEVANFDMYSVRRTSMAHGLFTDAVSRFNKGQSPLQTRAVLAKIVSDIQRLANGKVASSLVDDVHLPNGLQDRNSVHMPVTLTVQFINERLGLTLSGDEISRMLTNVEFDVLRNADQLTVKAPFWRTDIEIAEDVVEEVGRLFGFDHLPLNLPRRSLAPAIKNPSLELKQRLRDSLSRAGASEVLTYSFVHGKLLEKANQDPEQAYKLSNALSPDLQYYRLSLTPSLLDKVHANIKAGYGEFSLFEIGKTHIKGHASEDGLPHEFDRLALVFAADKKAAIAHAGAPYYQALRMAMACLTALGLESEVRFTPLSIDETDTAAVYYQPGRAATITIDNQVIGRIGEFAPSVRQALKLPEFSAGFEFGIAALAPFAKAQARYIPLSRFPKVEQDLCLKVPVVTDYWQVYDLVQSQVSNLQPDNSQLTLSPVDIYQRPDDLEHKQITLRLSLACYDKTLRDSEVTAILDHVADAAHQALQADKV